MTQQTRWNMWISEVKTFFWSSPHIPQKWSFYVTRWTFLITLVRFEKRFENYWSINNTSAQFLITKTSLIIYWILFFWKNNITFIRSRNSVLLKTLKKFWTKASLCRKKYLKSTIWFNSFADNINGVLLIVFCIAIVDFNDLSYSIGLIVITFY